MTEVLSTCLIQTASNPRREAVRVGVAKRAFRYRSRYLLGGTLVCAVCGSNYIGDGARDFVCPAHTSGHCDNDMRFRRDTIHQAVFDLMKDHLLSDEVIARGKRRVEAELREQHRQEEAAARRVEDGSAVRKLDAQARALRDLDLPPSAVSAALAEIERKRAELLTQASERRPASERRALSVLARLPEIVDGYRKRIEHGIKVLARPEVVADASEALRRLLVDGRITLAPNADRTAVVGPVHFLELGDHVLQLAGWQQNCSEIKEKLIGSGGRIWDVPDVPRSVRVK
jgi:hypothetical protein